MALKPQPISLIALILLSILLTGVYFYPIVTHVDSVLLASGGDGIKNYFTYLYYIQNDLGSHFSGMNYPFGEVVVFTDNMPLMAWMMKLLGSPVSIPVALGIMHAALFITLTIAVIYIYKIIKLFHVPDWWAILSSLFIIYFSPQLFKMYGHFGMAFLCYLPMQIFWLMCYHKNNRLKYPIYIALSTTLFTFLHVYQLAFSIILIGCYLIAYLLIFRKKSWASKIRTLLPLSLSVVIAWAVLALYLKQVDLIQDRPAYPYGVFGARTVLSDIFTSSLSPLGFTFQFLFGNAAYISEGYTYIGFVAILLGLFLIYRLVRSMVLRIVKRAKMATHPVRSFRIWLLVALLGLLFAMGAPFIWNLHFLADHLATLRQFRAMGRFSWPFYYLFLIFCAIFIYRLYQWLRYKDKHLIAKSMIGAILIIWVVQISGYAQWFQKNISIQATNNYKDYFSTESQGWSDWLLQQGYTSDDFQAIMALPFFHIGSEKLWLQDNDYERTMYYGSQLSLQTGLPMMNVMMSRSSWSQTFALVQLLDGPFSEKPLLDSFSGKPILTLVNVNFPLKPKEKEWIENAKLIGTRSDLALYATDLHQMTSSSKALRHTSRKSALLSHAKEGLIGNDTAYYYTDHFDDQLQTASFEGKGAFCPSERTQEQLIADMPLLLDTSITQNYYFSIWVHCDSLSYKSPYFILRQFDQNKQLINEANLKTKYSSHVINYWFLAEKILQIAKEAKNLKIYVAEPESYFELDELAFWPEQSVYFYKPNDSSLLLNNRPQRLP